MDNSTPSRGTILGFGFINALIKKWKPYNLANIAMTTSTFIHDRFDIGEKRIEALSLHFPIESSFVLIEFAIIQISHFLFVCLNGFLVEMLAKYKVGIICEKL